MTDPHTPDAELLTLTIAELTVGYRRGDFSPVEVVAAIAERMDEVKGHNAVLHSLVEPALEQAARIESMLLHGETPGPLAGVPVMIKDIIDVAGAPTTCGSAVGDTTAAAVDADVVRRLRDAGAIVVGKAHTYEFAWGITSDNEVFGPCLNPVDPTRTTGGSSSGSAASVALGLAPLAVGTDTAGSARIPAAFCGITGLRPTLGRISTTGVFPLARSFDTVGLLARTPADVLVALEAAAGPGDSDVLTSLCQPMADLPASAGGEEGAFVGGASLAGLRVGLATIPGATPPQAGIAPVVDAAVARLGGLGATVVPVTLPDADLLIGAFAPMQGAEAHDTHRRLGLYPGRADRYSDAVRLRLERGAGIDVAQYLAARELRRLVQVEIARVLADVDVIVSLVSPVPPPPVDGSSPDDPGGDRFRAAVLAYTVPQVLADLPACTVPVGVDDLGLPVGVQVAGRAGDERRVLSVAGAMLHTI